MEYLNLYKVYFKDDDTISDFLNYKNLEMLCRYLKEKNKLDTIEIYSLDMPKVIDKLQIIQTLKNKEI